MWNSKKFQSIKNNPTALRQQFYKNDKIIRLALEQCNSSKTNQIEKEEEKEQNSTFGKQVGRALRISIRNHTVITNIEAEKPTK